MRPYIIQNLETLGRAILEELFHHDWSQPIQATVEELGLAMGNHIGLKRSRNEDRIAVARVCAPNDEIYTVALVCDGVGGSEAGDQAATLAIAAVLFELCSQRARASVPDIAGHVVRCADDYVRQELGGRGTTTLSMFLSSTAGDSACVNVGDSRAYSWDPAGDIHQITTDDTVENELKALPGDHEALIKARGLKGRLSQAVGEAGRSVEDLRVQVFLRKHFRTGVLLGSDGLWKFAKDFETVMLNARTGIDAVRRGINLANWVGGLDNASIIAIEDLKKFCSPKPVTDAIRNRVSVSLWLGTSKFRFISDSRLELLNGARPENAGRKPAKPKKTVFKSAESQLELPETKIAFTEPKPAIEVTLGSGAIEEKGG